MAECGWLGSETKEGPYVMQDGSNRYGWDGKVEIRARVLWTGKQDGSLKGRQGVLQPAKGAPEGLADLHDHMWLRKSRKGTAHQGSG